MLQNKNWVNKIILNGTTFQTLETVLEHTLGAPMWSSERESVLSLHLSRYDRVEINTIQIYNTL